ncbi:MAG: DUF4347 domain-containing protein [candidate division Zixibacteria bacterium]|nr:DUF4347 domain-containing protein [candidate division Zixibacteria bacterium]
MKKRALINIALMIFLLAFFVTSFENNLYAEDKVIVVVEKSTDADDETNHESNNTNLPAGATSVEAESLDDAQTEILEELGDGDCIKDLHFRGHGSKGNQSVGDGVNHEDDKRIDGGDPPSWKQKLAGLDEKFCDGATIYLWGCHVGECDTGAAKLKEIADFFGVTVKGTVNTVYAGQQNDYDGPWQTATPDEDQPECVNSTDGDARPPKKSEGEYDFIPGDANMPNGIWPPMVIGADVTYLVNYFRGIAVPCLLDGFYCPADVNGDCLVIGSDVTRLVNYFRGISEIYWCPDYSPTWPTPDDLPPDAPVGWPNCE